MKLTFNDWVSYSRETIEKRFPDFKEVSVDHDRFSEGLECTIGNTKLTFGKLPSGRYVYLSSISVYPLRSFI